MPNSTRKHQSRSSKASKETNGLDWAGKRGRTKRTVDSLRDLEKPIRRLPIEEPPEQRHLRGAVSPPIGSKAFDSVGRCPGRDQSIMADLAGAVKSQEPPSRPTNRHEHAPKTDLTPEEGKKFLPSPRKSIETNPDHPGTKTKTHPPKPTMRIPKRAEPGPECAAILEEKKARGDRGFSRGEGEGGQIRRR